MLDTYFGMMGDDVCGQEDDWARRPRIGTHSNPGSALTQHAFQLLARAFWLTRRAKSSPTVRIFAFTLYSPSQPNILRSDLGDLRNLEPNLPISRTRTTAISSVPFQAHALAIHMLIVRMNKSCGSLLPFGARFLEKCDIVPLRAQTSEAVICAD